MASRMKRFHIEIEVDNIDSQDRMDAVTQAVQIIGGQAMTMVALIVGENPKPEVTMWAEDFEDGRQDVPFVAPEGE